MLPLSILRELNRHSAKHLLISEFLFCSSFANSRGRLIHETKNGCHNRRSTAVISRWVKSNSHTIAPSFSQSEGNPPRRSRGYIPEAWQVGCCRKCTSVPPIAMTNSRPYVEIPSPSRRRVTENDGEFTLGVIESIKSPAARRESAATKVNLNGISQRHIRVIQE